MTVPLGPEIARSWALMAAPSTEPAFWAAKAIMYTASYACDAYRAGVWLKKRPMYRELNALYRVELGDAGAVPQIFVTSTPTAGSRRESAKPWSWRPSENPHFLFQFPGPVIWVANPACHCFITVKPVSGYEMKYTTCGFSLKS